MSGETPFADRTDADLVTEAQLGLRGQGASVESMRRLRIAVERQSRASGRLTWAIIALMVVQILLAVVAVVKMR